MKKYITKIWSWCKAFFRKLIPTKSPKPQPIPVPRKYDIVVSSSSDPQKKSETVACELIYNLPENRHIDGYGTLEINDKQGKIDDFDLGYRDFQIILDMLKLSDRLHITRKSGELSLKINLEEK